MSPPSYQLLHPALKKTPRGRVSARAGETAALTPRSAGKLLLHDHGAAASIFAQAMMSSSASDVPQKKSGTWPLDAR